MFRSSLFLCLGILGAISSPAATIAVSGTFNSYTTVVGAADPYGFGLPESFLLVLNSSGSSILDGVLTMTGGSGKQFTLSGGTINTGATTDFIGINITAGAGSIGGTVQMSFNTSIPDASQASLDKLMNLTGSGSLFGFPFTNGAQGFYQGGLTVLTPEPSAMGLFAAGLGLVVAGVKRQAES